MLEAVEGSREELSVGVGGCAVCIENFKALHLWCALSGVHIL